MKPILLGMYDTRPVGLRRGGPLFPNPGTSGRRLLRAIQRVRHGTTTEEFCAAFDRRNVIDAQQWDWKEALTRAPELRKGFAGCVVICLGEEVRKALGIGCASAREFGPIYRETETYYVIPHPSGRNLWYNDPKNCERVGKFLAGFF